MERPKRGIELQRSIDRSEDHLLISHNTWKWNRRRLDGIHLIYLFMHKVYIETAVFNYWQGITYRALYFLDWEVRVEEVPYANVNHLTDLRVSSPWSGDRWCSGSVSRSHPRSVPAGRRRRAPRARVHVGQSRRWARPLSWCTQH